MRIFHNGAFSALLLATSLIAAGPIAQGPQGTVRPAPPTLLAQFDVTAGTVQVLDVTANTLGNFLIPVKLGGDQRTMALHPYEMRAPGFRLLVEDAFGIHQIPTPACVTYRGALVEEPSTKVVATVENGTVTATIYRLAAAPGGATKTWVVQPVNSVQPSVGSSVHLVYQATDTAPLPYQCGNVNVPAPPQTPQVANDITLECDIAIEADVEFYQIYGSNTTSTQNDITSIMNSVEFIYNRDCDVQYNITTILVSTTSVYSSNSSGTLLSQFASRWNSVHAGISRDVAHLFTGRNLTGSTIGVAYLGVICSSGSGYGLSQSRFTSNFNSRVGLTAHELGHNWAAPHCSSPGCYIMCSGLGGCNNNVTLFGSSAISQITNHAATRNCLTPVPTTPVITSVTPSSISVFSPGQITLTGSGFIGTTAYRIGIQTFTSGFSVINDNTMTVAAPNASYVGLVTMDVTNASGTSSPTLLLYTTTSPPKLTLTSMIPTTGGTAVFEFAGIPSRQWFLVLGISNQTSPFQAYSLLSNPLLLAAGTFPGPLGIDSVSIPVPGGLGLLIFYAQILEASATLPIATGVSNIRVTVLL